MSVPDTCVRWRCVSTLAVVTCLTVMGCSLFSSVDMASQMTAGRPVLPPLKAPADAVQMQLIFIERPADDPLISRLIWQELDQVGTMAPEARSLLDQNGIRVGQSGSHPPPALQKLLGLTESVVDARDEERQLMRGRRIGLRSSQESDIQMLDEPLESARVHYVLGGKHETVGYEMLRPVLKVKPVRVQDGWIRLEFAPEMHHGASRLRHTPTDEGWTLRGGQECDARYALRFQLMLNNGEMVVISGDPDRVESPGHRMFCRQVEGRPTQRALVIRLVDSGKVDTDPINNLASSTR